MSEYTPVNDERKREQIELAKGNLNTKTQLANQFFNKSKQNLLTIMNRIKSKQNLNPNTFRPIKTEGNEHIKTRNQSKQLLKQQANNPQKSLIDRKKTVPKPQKKAVKSEVLQIKPQLKKEYLPAQMYYETDVIKYITEQSQQNFKKMKQCPDNQLYKTYREKLLESVFKDCIHFDLKPNTFYLYVHYLDSFIKSQGNKKLTMENAIMASYACFLMAQKYEEIYPPSIHEWLSQNHHKTVYQWESKIIFALNFKFIHESMYNFFQYWVSKYQMGESQKSNCKKIMHSILFNYEFLHKYSPQKIAKALVIMGSGDKRKKKADELQVFDSQTQKQGIISDIKKHIVMRRQRIQWISSEI